MSLADDVRARRRVLLASDRQDSSEELAQILSVVGDVSIVPTAGIPDNPQKQFSGVVVDIDLRSTAAIQQVRKKLLGKNYENLPRLFVLTGSLHHGSTQAWALGATDTIQRPFDAASIQKRLRAVLPDDGEEEREAKREALNNGVSAAHKVMVKIFAKLPFGNPLTLQDVMEAEGPILKAIKRTSIKDWLITVGRHHNHTYRHCLFVTGFAVAFAQHLGMREEDQRRLARAALLHDVGKAFIPLSILDKPGRLDEAEMMTVRKHAQLGYDALVAQGGYPREMLDVVLHHHEFLDGTGYPDGLLAEGIADIVRMITIVDIYAALVEDRAYKRAFSRAEAFAIMEDMGPKLDRHLLMAFRPVAMGS